VSPIEPRFEVYFIDFGNKEKLNSEDVRPLDAALSAVPAQARPAQLAYVKVGDARSSAGDMGQLSLGFCHI
jgi:staphylococcal nuclease domain-containing protein 1